MWSMAKKGMEFAGETLIRVTTAQGCQLWRWTMSATVPAKKESHSKVLSVQRIRGNRRLDEVSLIGNSLARLQKKPNGIKTTRDRR